VARSTNEYSFVATTSLGIVFKQKAITWINNSKQGIYSISFVIISPNNGHVFFCFNLGNSSISLQEHPNGLQNGHLSESLSDFSINQQLLCISIEATINETE